MAYHYITLEVQTSVRLTKENIEQHCTFYYTKYDDNNHIEIDRKIIKDHFKTFEIIVEEEDKIIWGGKAAGLPSGGTPDPSPLTAPEDWETCVNILWVQKSGGNDNHDLLGSNELTGQVLPVISPRIPEDFAYGTSCEATVKDKIKGDTEEYTIYFTVGNQMGLFSIDPEIKINPNA